MFFRRKPKLTKEQQDNVVRCIVRGYDPITSVEFTQFSKDLKTGFYLLSIKLNESVAYETTLFIRSIDTLNDSRGIFGLNPVNRFANLERKVCLAEDSMIDLTGLTIVYLGESQWR